MYPVPSRLIFNKYHWKKMGLSFCYNVCMFEQLLVAMVQGLTEFLPISSSGHIAITERIFGIEYSLFMLIWLHASSLLAVIVYYVKDLLIIARDVLLLLLKQENEQGALGVQLIGATVITGVLGLLLKPVVEDTLSFTIIGIMLIVTAALIYLAESLRTHTKGGSFTWLHTAGVGIAQGLAVFPGLSRSGTTITYLIGAGLNRTEAVRISFLLSIPTIGATLALGLLDSENLSLITTPTYILIFIVGFLTSLISIKLMNIWVEKYWKLFIPYCVVIGILVVVFL